MNYKPQRAPGFNDNYALFLVKAKTCPICKAKMVRDIKWNNGLFPQYWVNNFDSQVKAMGWIYESKILVDDENICIDCERNNLATFLCALCNERKNTEKIRKSYGDPAEFLCSDCYENVSAKTWLKKEEELIEKHKHDFD